MNRAMVGEQEFEHIFKIVLVGDASVGKTFLLNRYIRETVPKHQGPTIGVEFATKIVTLKDNMYVKAQIWDTAGQEKYRAMTAALRIYRHYRKSVGALVVYDLTKRSTFDSITRWIKELKANAEPDIVVMIVGNKLDICDDDPTKRQVTKEEGEKLAASQGAIFEETSAVQNINVKAAFESLMERIYDATTSSTIAYGKKGAMGEKLGTAGLQEKKSCSC